MQKEWGFGAKVAIVGGWFVVIAVLSILLSLVGCMGTKYTSISFDADNGGVNEVNIHADGAKVEFVTNQYPKLVPPDVAKDLFKDLLPVLPNVPVLPDTNIPVVPESPEVVGPGQGEFEEVE